MLVHYRNFEDWALTIRFMISFSYLVISDFNFNPGSNKGRVPEFYWIFTSLLELQAFWTRWFSQSSNLITKQNQQMVLRIIWYSSIAGPIMHCLHLYTFFEYAVCIDLSYKNLVAEDDHSISCDSDATPAIQSADRNKVAEYFCLQYLKTFLKKEKKKHSSWKCLHSPLLIQTLTNIVKVRIQACSCHASFSHGWTITRK